jgi:predicted transcriptional regulator
MATTTLTIDDDLEARIEKLAEERGQTSDALKREAMSEFVTRAEAYESFQREADEAWEHYQRTGLHITGEELFEWLRTWGTKDDKGPPECHD